MKKILLLVTVLFSLLCQAQEQFSLKLELVHPSGTFGERSYFMVTLKNLTDSIAVIYQDPYPSWPGFSSVRSYLVFDYQYKNGTVKRGNRRAFFNLDVDLLVDEKKRLFILNPRQEYVHKIIAVRIPDAGPVLNIYAAPEIAKVRCRIGKFEYVMVDMPTQGGAGYRGRECVSNWVDVSQADYSFYKFWKPEKLGGHAKAEACG